MLAWLPILFLIISINVNEIACLSTTAASTQASLSIQANLSTQTSLPTQPSLPSSCPTGGDPCFWMDVQRKNGVLQHFNGTNVSAIEIQSLPCNLSINSGQISSDVLWQYGTGITYPTQIYCTAVSSNSLAQYALCELPVNVGGGMPSGYGCDCGWINFNNTVCMRMIPLNTSRDMAGGVTACTSQGAALSRSFGFLSQNALVISGMIVSPCGSWKAITTSSGGLTCYQTPNATGMPATWFAAETTCIQMGGHLASFMDTNYIDGFPDFLQQFCRVNLYPTIPASPGPFWVGFNDYAENGQLVYADYTYPPVSSAYDTFLTTSITQGTCITWDGQSPTTTLQRAPCTNLHNYFCQKDPEPPSNLCSGSLLYFSPYCYNFTNQPGKASCSPVNGENSFGPSFHTLFVWQQFQRYFMAMINLNEPSGTSGTESVYIGMTCLVPSNYTTCVYDDGTNSNWGYWDTSNFGSGQCVISSRSYNNSYRWRMAPCTSPGIVVCQSPPPITVPSPCPSGWDAIAGAQSGQVNCYLYPNPQSAVTWDEAERNCHELGGVLPDFIYASGTATRQDTLPDWTGFQEYRSGLNFNTQNLWMGWSKYAFNNNPTYVNLWISNTFKVESSGFYYANWTTWNDNTTRHFALSNTSAATVPNYMNWIPVDLSTTANYICKYLNNTCANYQLYYQIPLYGGSEMNQPGVDCYFTTNQTMNYSNANAYCQNYGATLVDFQASDWSGGLGAGFNFPTLRNVFINIQYYPTSVWVGYSRRGRLASSIYLDINFNRSWSDANFVSWGQDWAPGYPLNISNDTSYCLAMSASGGNNLFMDNNCQNSNGFICKQQAVSTTAPYALYTGVSIPINPPMDLPINPMEYYVLNGTMTYNAAQLACQNIGGQLPTFHSDDEWEDFVRYRYVQRDGYNRDVTNVWIALQRNSSLIYWTWPNIQTDNYNWSRWALDEPVADPSKLCTISYNNDTGDMYWYSADCSSLHHVICQIRLVPITNPCPIPGFIWRDIWNRCIFTLENYTMVNWNTAAQLCGANDLSLPGFDNLIEWNNFSAWTSTGGNMAMFTTLSNDIWPLQPFWLGLNDQTGSWQWDDATTVAYSNFLSPSVSAGPCVYSNGSTAMDSSCQVNMTRVVCQNRPANQWCPSPWLMASPTICYSPPLPGLASSNNYTAAFDLCQNMTPPGLLPSFHNMSEWQDFMNEKTVIERIQGYPFPQAGAWLGLKDTHLNGTTWSWDDNSTFDWNNWWQAGLMPQTTPNQCSFANFGLSNYQWQSMACAGGSSYAVICQLRKNVIVTTCPPGWVDLSLKCFKLVSATSTDLNTAKNQCALAGGRLPGFDSMAHYEQFLTWKINFDRASSGNISNFFIGLTVYADEYAMWSNYTATVWPLAGNLTSPAAGGTYDPTMPMIASESSYYNWTQSSMPASVFCEYGTVPVTTTTTTTTTTSTTTTTTTTAATTTTEPTTTTTTTTTPSKTTTIKTTTDKTTVAKRTPTKTTNTTSTSATVTSTTAKTTTAKITTAWSTSTLTHTNNRSTTLPNSTPTAGTTTTSPAGPPSPSPPVSSPPCGTGGMAVACTLPNVATYTDGTTCYAIFPFTSNWYNQTYNCQLRQNLFWPNMDYARAAVFTDNGNNYMNAMNGLQANAILKNISMTGPIWLGAMTTHKGTLLTDYCWMTDANHEGSQVSVVPTPVQTGGAMGWSSDPFCLFSYLTMPSYIGGSSCWSWNAMMCEFGCSATNPPATCNVDPYGSLDGTGPSCTDPNVCAFGPNTTFTTPSIPADEANVTCDVEYSCEYQTTINGSTYLFNDVCYAIINAQSAWANGYTGCNDVGLTKGSFYPEMDYGQVPVFAAEWEFNSMMSSLLSYLNTSNIQSNMIWIGAEAFQGGILPSDYCWMPTSSQPAGPQITNITTLTNVTVMPTGTVATAAAPLCLAVSIYNYNQWYGLPCNDPAPMLLCAFGCGIPNSYNNMCPGTSYASSCNGGPCWVELIPTTTTSTTSTSTSKTFTTPPSTILTTPPSTVTSTPVTSSSTLTMVSSTITSMSSTSSTSTPSTSTQPTSAQPLTQSTLAPYTLTQPTSTPPTSTQPTSSPSIAPPSQSTSVITTSTVSPSTQSSTSPTTSITSSSTTIPTTPTPTITSSSTALSTSSISTPIPTLQSSSNLALTSSSLSSSSSATSNPTSMQSTPATSSSSTATPSTYLTVPSTSASSSSILVTSPTTSMSSSSSLSSTSASSSSVITITSTPAVTTTSALTPSTTITASTAASSSTALTSTTIPTTPLTSTIPVSTSISSSTSTSLAITQPTTVTATSPTPSPTTTLSSTVPTTSTSTSPSQFTTFTSTFTSPPTSYPSTTATAASTPTSTSTTTSSAVTSIAAAISSSSASSTTLAITQSTTTATATSSTLSPTTTLSSTTPTTSAPTTSTATLLSTVSATSTSTSSTSFTAISTAASTTVIFTTATPVTTKNNVVTKTLATTSTMFSILFTIIATTNISVATTTAKTTTIFPLAITTPTLVTTSAYNNQTPTKPPTTTATAITTTLETSGSTAFTMAITNTTTSAVPTTVAATNSTQTSTKALVTTTAITSTMPTKIPSIATFSTTAAMTTPSSTMPAGTVITSEPFTDTSITSAITTAHVKSTTTNFQTTSTALTAFTKISTVPPTTSIIMTTLITTTKMQATTKIATSEINTTTKPDASSITPMVTTLPEATTTAHTSLVSTISKKQEVTKNHTSRPIPTAAITTVFSATIFDSTTLTSAFVLTTSAKQTGTETSTLPNSTIASTSSTVSDNNVASTVTTTTATTAATATTVSASKPAAAITSTNERQHAVTKNHTILIPTKAISTITATTIIPNETLSPTLTFISKFTTLPKTTTTYVPSSNIDATISVTTPTPITTNLKFVTTPSKKHAVTKNYTMPVISTALANTELSTTFTSAATFSPAFTFLPANLGMLTEPKTISSHNTAIAAASIATTATNAITASTGATTVATAATSATTAATVTASKPTTAIASSEYKKHAVTKNHTIPTVQPPAAFTASITISAKTTEFAFKFITLVSKNPVATGAATPAINKAVGTIASFTTIISSNKEHATRSTFISFARNTPTETSATSPDSANDPAPITANPTIFAISEKDHTDTPVAEGGSFFTNKLSTFLAAITTNNRTTSLASTPSKKHAVTKHPNQTITVPTADANTITSALSSTVSPFVTLFNMPFANTPTINSAPITPNTLITATTAPFPVAITAQKTSDVTPNLSAATETIASPALAASATAALAATVATVHINMLATSVAASSNAKTIFATLASETHNFETAPFDSIPPYKNNIAAQRHQMATHSKETIATDLTIFGMSTIPDKTSAFDLVATEASEMSSTFPLAKTPFDKATISLLPTVNPTAVPSLLTKIMPTPFSNDMSVNVDKVSLASESSKSPTFTPQSSLATEIVSQPSGGSIASKADLPISSPSIQTPDPKSIKSSLSIDKSMKPDSGTGIVATVTEEATKTTTSKLNAIDILQMTMMTLGCLILIGMLSTATALFILTKQFSVEGIIHLNEEISLICAHLIILGFGKWSNNFNLTVASAIGLQFFFLARFNWMILESVQTYAVLTNVINSKGYFTGKMNMVIGWAPPAALTLTSTLVQFAFYPSEWTCWANMSSDMFFATLGPICGMCTLTTILTEAAGTNNFKRLPNGDEHQYNAAQINLYSMVVLLPLCACSWFFGVWAVYSKKAYLYGIVFILHVSIAVKTFMFHILGNPEVVAYLKKLWAKLRKKPTL